MRTYTKADICPTGSSVGWQRRFSTQLPLDGHHRLHCVVFAIAYFLLYETYGLVILQAHKAFMEQQSDKNYGVEGEDNSPLWSNGWASVSPGSRIWL
jgi:hypothetical protein